MLKSYKTELDPNNKQITVLNNHADACRFVYNWGLEKKKKAFDLKEKIPSAYSLCNELTVLKKTEHNWLYEVSSTSLQYALNNLQGAFNNFFRRCKDKLIKKKGFPKFKSKKKSRKSFSFSNKIFSRENGYIILPKIGKLKLKQKNYFPIGVKIRQATVSKTADRWFVSILIDEEIQELPKLETIVGVDLGIKNLATLSDDNIFENPKALIKNLKKLKKLSRQHSRKAKDSKNREKSRIKLAKLHAKIANIRKDSLHKATTSIINENQVIILEDLKVSNMLKNEKLARVISDVGLSEFRRQIEYKAKWYSREVQFVDTFFPSSKLCSNCGNKKEDLKLSDRVYNCSKCNFTLNRDLNAALNIRNQYTDRSSGIQASGDGSSAENENSMYSLLEKEESHISYRV